MTAPRRETGGGARADARDAAVTRGAPEPAGAPETRDAGPEAGGPKAGGLETGGLGTGDLEAGDLETAVELWRLADPSVAFALRAVASLGVPDHLAAGPLTVPELAAASGADPAALGRVLRALAAKGVFEQAGPGRYGLAGPGQALRSDHPLSLREAYGLWPEHVRAWAEYAHSVRTGEAAFERAHGVPHRRYRADNPAEDARMDRAHRAATRVDVLMLVRVYDWSAVRTVVDVGGGTGAFLVGLLSRFPRMRGVLFDLPRMVARAGEVLPGSGVEDRVEVVGGDFFEAVPPGGDVYVLKAVLGGWADEPARRILATVRAAMPPGARLLVIEPILQYGAAFTMGNVVHLQSLVLYGGPDRTREDYDRLAAEAGLRVTRVVPRATLPILELVPL
ncbi:methyltransferase [Bailinhaonella thermotolerans]|uniref:Methyltransferase n=1 Tax=Bailinhaonella thermotolerans TaxID=1070861 RepID=A0A3A4AN19_9ACTN|nr:methyltransferase [Bailinhaonella thermotolerans]RJL27213.1 methyltransferase [Bailinhaonella thermotolerans]